MSAWRASLRSAIAEIGAIGLSLFGLALAFPALIGLLLFPGTGLLSANLTAKPLVSPSVNELRVSVACPAAAGLRTPLSTPVSST